MLAILSFIAMLVFSIGFVTTQNNTYTSVEPATLKKFLIGSCVLFSLTFVLSILIPSKKELCVIYGVGSIIDYVQENPDANQLPDKTVKFLNAVADKYIDNNDTTKTTN